MFRSRVLNNPKLFKLCHRTQIWTKFNVGMFALNIKLNTCVTLQANEFIVFSCFYSFERSVFQAGHERWKYFLFVWLVVILKSTRVTEVPAKYSPIESGQLYSVKRQVFFYENSQRGSDIARPTSSTLARTTRRRRQAWCIQKHVVRRRRISR